MLSLRQSKRIRGAAGNPLPVVYQALETRGTRFLRGQLVLISAGGGTGKSAVTLNLALRSKVPTLYFSADSDAFTQLTRSIAILCDTTLEAAAKAVRSDDLAALDPKLEGVPIRFNYEATPTLDTLETSLGAYYERYNEFPTLIIVDNVTNVRGNSDDDDPFSGLESLMDYLHDMARKTGACVAALHHVTGPFNDASKPIPLSGVKGQITRVPEMVLTIHRMPEMDDPAILCVSTVKNRAAKADPSGNSYAELEFYGDRMLITDPRTGFEEEQWNRTS